MEIELIEQYIKEIKTLRKRAEDYVDETPGALRMRLKLLTQCHELMGRVSAHMDGEYERAKALRANTYAIAKRDADRGDKVNAAELAVMELRKDEAAALERSRLWKNEFKALAEHLYEIRLAIRMELNIMAAGGEV